MKVCKKCSIAKSLEHFNKWKCSPDGYKPYCKECTKKDAIRYRISIGGTPHIDRSKENSALKTCTKCKKLKPRKGFGKSSWCSDCRRIYAQQHFGYSAKIIPIVQEGAKECCDCRIIKPLENFSPSKRGRLGKSAYCKLCSTKRRLAQSTKEERRASTQRYRNNNRFWWRSLHRVTQFNRRNKIKAVSDGTVTPEFVRSIYNIEQCYYCKENTPEKFRTLEHKHPLNKGGLHTADNIVMACLCCNSSKQDMTEEQFKIYSQ